METKLTATVLTVEGMDCAGCARKIDGALRGMDGVRDVSLHFPDPQLGVLHDERAKPEMIRATVESLGFSVSMGAGDA